MDYDSTTCDREQTPRSIAKANCRQAICDRQDSALKLRLEPRHHQAEVLEVGLRAPQRLVLAVQVGPGTAGLVELGGRRRCRSGGNWHPAGLVHSGTAAPAWPNGGPSEPAEHAREAGGHWWVFLRGCCWCCCSSLGNGAAACLEDAGKSL